MENVKEKGQVKSPSRMNPLLTKNGMNKESRYTEQNGFFLENKKAMK